MVAYNPNLPHVLGQEWVPIRDEALTFDENTSSTERGHTFTLTAPTQVGDVRYYINEWAYGAFYNQGYTATIYAEGTEDLTGPIQKVVIPCNNGATTGAGITFDSPATNVPTALDNPGNEPFAALRFDASAGFTGFQAFFAVNQYAQALQGKRILGVTLVTQYRVTNNPGFETDPNAEIVLAMGINGDVVTPSWEFQPVLLGNTPPQDSRITRRDKLGNISLFFGEAAGTTNTIPWTYAELQRFEQTYGVGRAFAVVSANTLNQPCPPLRFTYMALEVYYCEETRLAYGSKLYSALYTAGNNQNLYQWGLNPIRMWNLAGSTYPVLAAGDYTVTVTQASLGDNLEAISNFGPHVTLNAVREMEPISSFETVEVTTPFPVDDTAIGRTAERETSVIVPQISVHTTGGVALTEVHAYGQQIAAQIWGNYYAIQELLDTPVGSSELYPWVRFIARRYGDTTVPLTLTGEAGLAAFTASITPDEFDDLDYITRQDGWKEITLRLDPPPPMGTIGAPQWRWTATGELAGNRWEVLGASAPAVSGVTGNLYNFAPTAQQLYNATYSSPTGAVQELEWYPQGVGTPFVTGAGVADDSSDAFLIFAQDLPTISGFGVTVFSQALTGIGQDCGADPCCIPNEIFYNRITWTNLSNEVQASDFGYYQLQRMDTVETDWQTIMEATALTGSAFNDFEARIGIESSYRIRAVDLYGFYGLWSDTITSTIPAPGIDGGDCVLDGHLLTFTSNERQCGEINLAYSSVWMDQRVEEDFNFPEAGFVQMQAMYDRDYFTAFRPLERGGETFTRTMLVQAAAIDPETLADFRSFRDMAWDTVNYICVRDEDGNRWFASVTVPSGKVLLNRSLYLAPVTVIEVTDVPTPVDAEFCEPPEPPPAFDCSELIAADSFTRTESDIWGTADLGGSWTEA